MKNIYLDYAATTPCDKDVVDSMLPYFSENFGNPSSVHSAGQLALGAVDKARAELANFLGCSPSEVIFTSGATESNNFAIKGILRKYYFDLGKNAPVPHIITSAIEHHCILDTCRALEREGLAEVTYLSIDENGFVDAQKIERYIQENTILISLMYVNNEIGTIQPIKEVGALIESINKLRESEAKQRIIFHTDAVQAANYLDCDVNNLQVDLMSLSGHKVYGPKGVGALFIRKGVKIKPLLDGGGQEFKLRAGTHNVSGIVGFGKAISKVKGERAENNKKLQELCDHLISRVLSEIPNSYLNGAQENRTPNNANFRFDSVEGEGLLLSLDMEGIFASTGSACSSGSLEPSHVLLALGLRHEQAHGSLRITLGKNTEREDVDFAIEKIKEVVAKLRKISGNILKDFENEKK